MQTEDLFREDSYLKECEAEVIAINELGGVILDQTVFYPTGGGQPGDSGFLISADGAQLPVHTTVYDKDRTTIVHVLAEDTPRPAVGDQVTCQLDWPRRYSHMRVHTALHLLSAVLPYPVTGGQIGDGTGRLDFDIEQAGLDKEEISAKLNQLVEENSWVATRHITDEELAEQPELVKTMSVKPPTGSGLVRLVEIDGRDLQPCGGTHVANTGEIGALEVTKIEKKGARNRRVRLRLKDALQDQ
jgi:misacylated tRNA(Ala) deacylase